MSAFLILWRRELQNFFLSPVAYVVMTFFLLVMGVAFYFLTSLLADGVPGVGVMNLMFGSPFYWMAQLVAIPLLTMRLFAEERRMGTLETLLTAPVTDTQVVAGKFAGVLSFYVVMWIPTTLFLHGLQRFSSQAPPLDPGIVAAGYLGVFLSGMMFLSIGLLCSLTTSNQIVSAITCFAVLIILFFAGFMQFITSNQELALMADLISPQRHLQEFARGMIDTRPLVFYASGTVLCLFTSVRLLESRQWR